MDYLLDSYSDLPNDPIYELYWELTTQRVKSSATFTRQAELIRLMWQENDELRLRVGVLLRLLIKQNVISADQFTAAIEEARADVALARAQTQRPTTAKPIQKAPRARPLKTK